MIKRLMVVWMAVVAIGALLGAASAQARLDPSFGEGGIASIKPPAPPGWLNEKIDVIATGQNGETYVVANQAGCFGVCARGDFVFRYLADGSIEPAFANSRGYEIPTIEGEAPGRWANGSPLIAVDSNGLPLVARVSTGGEGAGAVVLRRLLTNGALDTTFGTAGVAQIPCPCTEEGETQLLAGPDASSFMVSTSVTRPKRSGSKSGSTAAATLIKLDSTGQRAKGYGARGSVTAQMPGEGTIEYDAITPTGATFFGGRGLTEASSAGFLVKVTAKGKIDGKFKQRALRSLRRLKGLKGYETRVTAAVVGRKGPVELFGSAGGIGGFELRLRPDGTLQRGWAQQGLKVLPFAIVAAVQGREGSTMALTGEEPGPPRLLRILSKGNLDPVFGVSGEELPGATGQNGLTLYPAGIGRVGVSNLGLRECRGVCQIDPRIYRFLEGR